MNQKQIHIRQTGILSSNWLIWLFAICFVWTGLGTYGVLNNNEGLYANIPFDMLDSGDITHWIIPHLNGLPYMEKPPMLYWLTAISFLIFGQAEWVVRLVPSLAGLACVGLILNFGQRIYRPQVGRLAALMFISGFGVILISRTLLFDMLLTAFLTSALMFAYFFQIEGRKVDLRIAYASLAFAVLTKGFIALILFGSVVGAWIILFQSWGKLSKWFDPISICLFFTITVPWFVAASLIEPIFPWFFFINEHVLRFLGQRIPQDYYGGPWWYYLPRTVLFLFPWSLLLPIVFFSSWSKLSRDELQEFSLLRKALILGWLIPFVFFSISSAKANYYVIAFIPFAALNLALLSERSNFLQGKCNLVLGIIVALLTGAMAVMLQFFSNPFLSDALSSEFTIVGMSTKDFTLVVLWSVTGMSLMVAIVAWRFSKVGLVAYTALSLFFLTILLIVANARDSSFSDRSLAQFIQQTLPNRSVYLYRLFEQNSSLSFYLKKSLNVIDSNSNDLYWGDKLRPENNIMVTSKQFEKLKDPSAVVVPNEFLDEFMQKKWQKRFTKRKQFSRVILFY